MQTNAAVFRTGPVLEEGCKLIDEAYQELKDLKVSIGNSKLNLEELQLM